MLFKLAFRNVKRQISNYLIYFITVTLTVALIFAVNNIIFSELMEELQEMYVDFLQPVLLSISAILSIIIAFVLSYVTSFLLRRRKKEFGLYLTIGMTRGNILAIFAGETAITFALSLGFGILLGLGLYQALMAIFINFLEVEFVLSGYSATGILVTILMVVIMFVIASVASFGYLRFAKISRLLNGEKAVEKTVKQPVIWLCISIAALGMLLGSVFWLYHWLYETDFFNRINELLVIIAMFCTSVILLPMGLAKGILPLFIKHNEKTLSSKGTAVFTMRALSGRLNANSAMAGVLTFLLLIAIILPNIFLTQNGIIAAQTKQRYPFDIRLQVSVSYYEEGDKYRPHTYEKEIQTIEKYADIEETYQYTVYEYSYEQFNYICVIKESDYNKLCAMLGEKTVQLNGGFLTCYEDGCYDNQYYSDLFKVDKITLGGVTYFKEGEQKCLNFILSSNTVVACFAVIPDGAVNEKAVELKVDMNFLAVTLKNSHYDSRALQNELYDLKQSYGDLREYHRLDDVGAIALFLLGCLFISAVFILMSMAMLALKMLSMLSEDRQRYKTLWQLGADEHMIYRSLFLQMFFFYFLPFALPFLMSGAMAVFFVRMVMEQGITVSGFALFGQVISFTVVILTLYALYFTATYLIARRDIKKTLQSIG